MHEKCKTQSKSSRPRTGHKQHFKLTTAIALLLAVLGSPAATAIDLKLETPQDFERYNFTCETLNPAGDFCELKGATSPDELPDYFPDRFKALPWPEAPSSHVFWVEGSGTSSRFHLQSTYGSIPAGKVIAVNITTYYNEVEQGFGLWFGLEPHWDGPFSSQWLFPGHDPNRQGEWLTSEQSLFQGHAKRVGILLNNNRVDRITVFHSIQFVIDPTPQLVHEIREPADLARLSFSSQFPDTEVKGVANASQLPPHFPEWFRTLPAEAGETIMWIDFNATLPERRHRFLYHPDLPGGRPTPAGVLFEVVGKTFPAGGLGVGFGYGPHLDWTGDPSRYIDFFLWDSIGDGWDASDNRLVFLQYFRETDGVGIVSAVNQRAEFAVFKSIRISYYWWPRDGGTTTTTTTAAPTTTTVATTTTTTAPTTTTTTSAPTTATADSAASEITATTTELPETDAPTTEWTEPPTSTTDIGSGSGAGPPLLGGCLPRLFIISVTVFYSMTIKI